MNIQSGTNGIWPCRTKHSITLDLQKQMIWFKEQQKEQLICFNMIPNTQTFWTKIISRIFLLLTVPFFFFNTVCTYYMRTRRGGGGGGGAKRLPPPRIFQMAIFVQKANWYSSKTTWYFGQAMVNINIRTSRNSAPGSDEIGPVYAYKSWSPITRLVIWPKGGGFCETWVKSRYFVEVTRCN